MAAAAMFRPLRASGASYCAAKVGSASLKCSDARGLAFGRRQACLCGPGMGHGRQPSVCHAAPHCPWPLLTRCCVLPLTEGKYQAAIRPC